MLIFPKYTKILKLAVCLFMITTAIFLSAHFALAANFWNANGTADPDGAQFANDAGLAGSGTNLYATITRIIRWFIGFLGIIAVILIIYAGFIWMTSGGDEQKVEQAKTILKNALIGLILIILAFAIVSFILNFLTGATGGGGNGPGNRPPVSYGLSALGNGIIQSHYPARDQKEVPRNTSIIISFREAMQADTLCVNPVPQGQDEPDKCVGDIGTTKGDINMNVIGIFKKGDEDECVGKDNLPLASCPSFVRAEVYSTDDGKTFVFVPNSYLGSASEYIDYTVYLGKGLLRQTGELAFPSGFSRDYGWSFEVSNKIDLEPPIVQSNGVFPSPDNLKDTRVPGVGAQARGTITVNSSPAVYSDALVSVAIPDGAPWGATATVDKGCNQNGEFRVNVDSNNKSIIRLTGANNILLGQGTVNGQTVTFSLCSLKLTLNSGDFAVNSLWTVTIGAMIAADTITVGNTVYTASNERGDNHFRHGLTNADTAFNITRVINPDSEVLGVTASNSGNTVTITAKFAGAAGNSINLSSSNSTKLPVVAMHDGTDKVDTVTARGGSTDKPMNSALQINFNEAIMPLTVSGTADEVKDFIRVVNASTTAQDLNGNCSMDAICKSFKCDGTTKECLENIVNAAGTAAAGENCATDANCKSSVCAGNPKKCVAANYLEGKFAISNQYQTVEFLSDKECGFNACGEKIYCLPANSDLRVELNAASLITCATNDDCKANSPFNTCDTVRKFCWDGAKYFPQAAKTYSSIVNGITDAAFNSLDGNRNDSAYGPASYYDENNPSAIGNGDNYKWSFFISDVLDLIPPKITATVPTLNPPSADLTNPVKISFNKVMLSSRLSTGSLMIQNGKQKIQHYLLNLRSLADQPVGYWVTNAGQPNGSGEIISTDAYINHSLFSKSSTYNAQAGSGLKDIYQNCFLPCSSMPGLGNCDQADNDSPCCCNGTVNTTGANKERCP